ncbi:MAG: methyltransferase domain-containing protein [Capnocytophaga sp.]|nr:methyltransferase domain-containing protein [Capnocytophaga sp.]
MFSFFLNRIPRPWLISLSYWVRPFLALYYRGNRYEDPIDRRTFRKFMDYGYANIRKNVLSPSTLSLERHRLLWLFLQKETRFFQQRIKVLHVAPEQAFYRRFRKIPQWEYITTDLESPLADVKADICNLPFADNSFDVILCNHVLEHIPDHRKAIQELFRVMKPNGTGIFQVPQDYSRSITFEDNSITDPKERTRIFGQYDHVRIYGMDYFDILRNEGFTVEALPYAATFSEEEIERYRIAKNEIIPLCRKP